MNFLYFIERLGERADFAQLAVVNCDIETVHSHRAQARNAIDRRPVNDRRFQNRLVAHLVETAEHLLAPVFAQDGERCEKTVGPPIRNPGNDQMTGWGHTSDRLTVLDMLGYQLTGQRTHADFIAAVPDRDRLPRPGDEKLIERRRVGADVETSHVARRAVGAAPAAFDRDRMGDPCAAAFTDYCD